MMVTLPCACAAVLCSSCLIHHTTETDFDSQDYFLHDVGDQGARQRFLESKRCCPICRGSLREALVAA
eukprot:COSAG01_NODE_1379_length_10522_cov_25.951454_2_plen_68_part_00